MTRAERLKDDLNKRIAQIKHIRHKVQRLNSFASSSTLRVFENRLKKRQEYFEDAYRGGPNWISYQSLSNTLILGAVSADSCKHISMRSAFCR